jgi:hypothetical protein
MADEKKGSDEGRQKLAEVMAEIKATNSLEQFAHDPVGYLKRKGINADGLTLSATPNHGEVSDADLAMVAGGGCFSLGYYACYSEGDGSEELMAME